MNTSEKVSSASPSPTNVNWHVKPKRQISRHSALRRSRSYSASPPSRSLSKHHSPRAFNRQRAAPRRSRSRDRRRPSSPYHHHQRSVDTTDRVEEYLSICIKNLNEKIDQDHLYDSIYLEFKRYGQFTIKIVYNKKSGPHTRSERIAFVNFCNHRTALAAKRDKNHKVLCGLPMYIEPVYKNYSSAAVGPPSLPRSRSRSASRRRLNARRSPSPRPRPRDFDRRLSPRPVRNDAAGFGREPKYSAPPHRARTPPPPPRLKYDDLAYGLSPKRAGGRPHSLMKASAPSSAPAATLNSAMHYFDDDDKDQTRTLFIGNLDADTQKDFLWKQFEKYGTLEDIDIKKNLPPGHADYAKKTYAFVRYENMDMAKEAKIRMNGKRIGQSEIKIGYGKVQATNCLWIGGLRDSSSIRDLEKEIKYILNTNDSSKFDILYTSPNNFAYVLFYNVKHAEEVRFELRGKSLSRSDKLRIDFHDPKKFNLLQPKPRSPRKSRSPSAKRRMVESDVPEENGESKLKAKSKVPNGSESKPNFENMIITKTDNVRRVDAVSAKHRSRSRSTSPQVKKKRSLSPNKNSAGQSDKREFDLGKERDEGEIDDSRPTTRHVIRPSGCLLDESYVHLSRSVMTKSIKSVNDMKTMLEPYTNWSGQLTLKKNSFPVKFYLLAGNKHLAESLLPEDNRDMNLLINQRIRLDSSKLDDIEKKLSEKFDNDDSVTYSVFLCVPSDLNKSDKSYLQKRSLHNLVSYLNQKCAAGVVSLPDDNRAQANLNIFTTSSNLSTKIFKQLLSGFRTEQLNEEQDNFLVCILLKASTV